MQVDGSVGRPSSPAPKGMPTLPGPTSQTPLLQAKFVVISVGGAVAAAADPAPPRLAATSDPVISRALSGERMTTSPGRRKRPVSVLAGWGESARGASGDTYPPRN